MTPHVPATVLPPDLHAPRYGAASLADVLPGVAAALGVPVERGELAIDPLRLTEALGGARRVAVLLVDGLGADLVDRHAHLAPTLAALAGPAGRLQAPCPSTTPVSLVTLGTGGRRRAGLLAQPTGGPRVGGPRHDAVAAGLFGSVDQSVADRIGDVVAFARGTWAFIDTEREPGPSRLAAYHGSLTETELAIPLWLARGPALG